MKRSESPQANLFGLEDHDDLDLLPPLVRHSRPSPPPSLKKRTPADASKTKSKSAQSLQTPSASPRHLAQPRPRPAPAALAKSSDATTSTTKRRRTSSLVFKNDRETDEMTPRKERVLRRSGGQTLNARPSPTKRNSRTADPTHSPRDVPAKRAEHRKRPEETRQQASRRGGHGEVARPAEDVIKLEESDDDASVVIKDEESAGEGAGAEFDKHRERQEEDERFETLRGTNGDSPLRAISPSHVSRGSLPRRSRSRSTSGFDVRREAGMGSSEERHNLATGRKDDSVSPGRSISIPTLEAFIYSLDLPRLARLIEPFHNLGIESAEDVSALASTTTAGHRRREEIWRLVEEMEREQGREFTKFEQSTLKVGLEASRQNWEL